MMKHQIAIIAVLILAACAVGHAQSTNGVRFGDGQPIWKVASLSQNITVVPNAAVQICDAPANAVPCTNYAQTYTDATLGVTCSSAAQIVLAGTNSCVATPDQYGNWGVWLSCATVQQYAYTVTVGGNSYGPYPATPCGNVNPIVISPAQTLASALAACPSSGCTIIPSVSQSMTSATIGSAMQPVKLILLPGVYLTATTGSFTLASGSSIIGSGNSQSGLICAINTSMPCLVTTRDYESQNYINGTQLQNFSVECNLTGCGVGLQTPGLGLGWTISGLLIDQTAAQCWLNNATTSSDWTEGGSLGVGIVGTNCQGNGFDINVSNGAFFNDVTFTDSQVRNQKGYFIKTTSGGTSPVSVNRLHFNNFHGLTGSATPTVQDGIYCDNGGGPNSISGWTFLGGELEGNSQTGYAINGNGANACSYFFTSGTTYNGWTSGLNSSGDVTFTQSCGAYGPCEIGLPFNIFGASLDRGYAARLNNNFFQGGFTGLYFPPYANNNGYLSDTVYFTPSSSVNSSISATTMIASGGGGDEFRVTYFVDVSAVGTGCSGNSSLTVNTIYTDPNASSSTTITGPTLTITTNGTLGANLSSSMTPLLFWDKQGANVQYSTTFSVGSGCSTAPSYQVYPMLEIIQ